MKRTTLIAALVAMLGSTALVVPTLATAQDSTTTPPAAQTADAPAAHGMGMGEGKGVGMGMGMGMRGPMFDFAAVDADKDGKVTEAEMKAWRSAQIAGMDADNDGKITEAELTAYMQTQMNARVAEMAKARIAAQDVDGDGALSVAEMAMPPMQGQMFARLDGNGDGAVTQDEMDAARARMEDMRGGRGDRMRDDDGEGHGGWFGKRGGGQSRDMMDGDNADN